MKLSFQIPILLICVLTTFLGSCTNIDQPEDQKSDKNPIGGDNGNKNVTNWETADSGKISDLSTTDGNTDSNRIIPDTGLGEKGCNPEELLCDDTCVLNDEKNCGACEHDCTALPHVSGPISCSAEGECLITDTSCAPGWAHCSTQADQGCETDTAQPENCGSCRNDCSAGSEKLCAPVEAVSTEYPTYACTSACPEHAPTLCDDNSCVDTNSSVNDCGGCSHACPEVEHGKATCVEGKCAIDCDNDYHQCDDACLSNASPDSCGNSCEPCEVPPNADPTCDGRECNFECKVGFLFCDGACVANDTKNCGSCYHDCTALPNVKESVDCDESGACVVHADSCTAGFAHCTSDPEDGCETDLSSTDSCGSCDKKCPATAPICTLTTGSTSAHPIYSCGTGCDNPGAPDLCSGSCVSTLTSATHCGGCGHVCPEVDNGRPFCENGKCYYTCIGSYQDCDENTSNGCESPIYSDVANCGSCGKRCDRPPKTSGAVCVLGQCGYTRCDSNYEDCNRIVSDGCEVNIRDDEDNCGGCNRECEDISNGSSTCSSGFCKYTCDSGYDPNGSQCELHDCGQPNPSAHAWVVSGSQTGTKLNDTVTYECDIQNRWYSVGDRTFTCTTSGWSGEHECRQCPINQFDPTRLACCHADCNESNKCEQNEECNEQSNWLSEDEKTKDQIAYFCCPATIKKNNNTCKEGRSTSCILKY